MHFGIQKDPARYNGKCKRCGAKASIFLVELRERQVLGRPDIAIDNQGREFEFVDGFHIRLVHECLNNQKRILWLDRVRGVYNPGKECNTKCLAAIGHDCECRCGGKNHGAGNTP